MMLVSHSISPVAGYTQHIVNNSFEDGDSSDTDYWTHGSYGRDDDTGYVYSGDWAMELDTGQTAYQSSLSVDTDEANYFSVKYKSTSSVEIRVYYTGGGYDENDGDCVASPSSWATCSITDFVHNKYINKVMLLSSSENSYFDVANLVSGISK